MISQNNVFDLRITGKETEILENQIVILGSPSKEEPFLFPFGLDSTCCIVIRKGSLDCTVDMETRHYSQPGLLTLLAFNIVEEIKFHEDFEGVVILFSKMFLDSLTLPDSIGIFMSIKSTPFSALDEGSLQAVSRYIDFLRELIHQKDHPYRTTVSRLITEAFCLGLGYYINPSPAKSFSNRADELTWRFFELLRTHCREERNLEFYANKLCISVKHLSASVKSSSGQSPIRWVENYSILYAKQLLVSTNDSIYMISEQMNFSSPSDFAKYFKKFTGQSPLTFRNQITSKR